MSEIQWEWKQASNISYQGTCSRGSCVLVWSLDEWTAIVVPLSGEPEKWKIHVDRNFHEATQEAEEWATWKLTPLREDLVEEEVSEEAPEFRERVDDLIERAGRKFLRASEKVEDFLDSFF